jgi:preprotein translocase SecF subunit
MFRGFHFVPPDTKIGFVKLRTISWVISALLTVVPLLLVWKVGLNYGIDFQGGTLMEIKTKESVADLAAIRAKVHGLNLGEVQIQEFGAPNDVLIRVAAQPTEKEQQESITKVKQVLGEDVEYRRVEVVGPTVSGELIAGGTLAVVIAMGAILLYIWFRFEWQFAVAAIASLVHDVTGTIGLYSALQLEFNLSSIAAILTIIGYSLNDKVVIFDRIRENLRKYRKMPLAELLDLSINDTVVVFDRIRENLRRYKRMPMIELLNLSINETLSRTVLTHVTTFLAMMPFVLVGGEAIFGFALAMVWGIVIGAYSSIYVAAPLQLILGVRREGGMTTAPVKAKARAGARA